MGMAAKSRILSHGLRKIALNNTDETAPEAPIEVYQPVFRYFMRSEMEATNIPPK